jgi:hypothetical protein
MRRTFLVGTIALLSACSKLAVDEVRPGSEQPSSEGDDPDGQGSNEPGDGPGDDSPNGTGEPDDGQPPSNTGSPQGNTDDPPGSTGTGTGTDEEPDPPEPGVTREPIRRLTLLEYRNTVRDLFPNISVATTDFAEEQKLDGFTNNTTLQQPSSLLTEQYFNSARDIAASLTNDQVTQLVGCNEGNECASNWVREFGRRAFRRPLSDSEQAEFMSFFEDAPGSSDFALAVKLAVMAMLQSPHFIYRPEIGQLDADGEGTDDLAPYEIASRLSYLAWGTMPDDTLLAAADDGSLTSPGERRAQLERMLDDPKAREGIGQFFVEWLRLDKVVGVIKLAEDNWDDGFRAEVSEAGRRFVYDEVFAKGGTAEDLRLSRNYPATTRFAELLGMTAEGDGWTTITPPSEERSGILTHPAFLGSHGYGSYPSPVLRGVFVMDRILCAPPSPPPGDVALTLPPPPDPNAPQTNRTGYVTATTGAICAGCHTSINGFGFAFENYDTLGKYRTEDSGFPVDASGEVSRFEFSNAIELASQIATSDSYRECIEKKWLGYTTAGSGLGKDAVLAKDVMDAFAADDYSLRTLVLALGEHDRFSSKLVVRTDE